MNEPEWKNNNWMYGVQPPDSVLNQCIKVILYDVQEKYYDIAEWGDRNKITPIYLTIADDNTEEVLTAYFEDEKDAVLFKLRWC